MVVRVFAVLASLVAFMQYGEDRSPGSLFAAVSFMLVYLGAEVFNRVPRGSRSVVDSKLYAQLIEQLPFSPPVRFLREHDWAGEFERAELHPIKEFAYTWDDEAHRFHDKKIDEARINLLHSVRSFLDLIVHSTWPVTGTECQCVPKEWRREQPERYDEVCARLNAGASRIVDDYEALVKDARKRLRL